MGCLWRQAPDNSGRSLLRGWNVDSLRTERGYATGPHCGLTAWFSEPLMIKFYYHPSPNPAKVALFLEEAGLEYELMPVDTRKGEQHSPTFRAINPNGKTPAIVDGEATIFDSSAILLYLAEKKD